MEDFQQSLTHSEPRLAWIVLARDAHVGTAALGCPVERSSTASPRYCHSGLLPVSFASDFFRCFAASSCSTRVLRWSSTELSTVSRAVVRANSYCLLSSPG